MLDSGLLLLKSDSHEQVIGVHKQFSGSSVVVHQGLKVVFSVPGKGTLPAEHF